LIVACVVGGVVGWYGETLLGCVMVRWGGAGGGGPRKKPGASLKVLHETLNIIFKNLAPNNTTTQQHNNTTTKQPNNLTTRYYTTYNEVLDKIFAIFY